VRHGLVVLIQQNLIYYYEDGQDGCHGTYYEANPDAAYGLVRVGKILELVESRCGVLGQDLVQNIFLLGHTRVCELTDIYNVNEQSAVNGDCDEIVATEHSIPVAKAPDRPCRDATFMLYYLLEAGFIEPVTKTMFRSPADRRNEVEKSLLGTDEFKGGIRGTKQKESLQNKIRENLESLRSTGQDWKLKGNKRALNGAFVNGTNRNAKRRKLLNGNIKHEDEEVQLEVGFSGF
jgi:DNA-directed RNA polymerase III subunit RPC3